MNLRRTTALAVGFVVVAAALAFNHGAASATGTDIVVLGGPAAVSERVAARLATCTTGSVSRIAGPSRYSTAAEVSAAFMKPGVDVVYVATGENFPDALAGSAAAGSGSGGPVLLVRPDSLPEETAAELKRLNPKIIGVLGGPAAITARVETALGAYGTVVRVAGPDRYSTGALVSEYAFPTGADTAYVAVGSNFPDAVAGAPAAIESGGPMLLVERDGIPAGVGAELARLGLSGIRILGGTSAVSSNVEAALRAYAPTVSRLSGVDRFATAAAVSRNTFAPGVGTIFVATGDTFPDALAGSAAAGILGGPMLLVERDAIPGATEAEIERLTGRTCGAAPSTGAQETDPNLRIAVIGDSNIRSDAVDVLQLIEDEGADFVIHVGDFDYHDDPAAFEDHIDAVLGPDYPYFVAVGNHDVEEWDTYQANFVDRLSRTPGAVCTGDYGVNSTCTYRGLSFILSGIGTLGEDHESHITAELADNRHTWRLCAWHKNQEAMQVGGKSDAVGWLAYETCREGGAIVVTGHEHSYSRTRTLVDMENQRVDPIWPEADSVMVGPGSTFVAVSGLGGASIREQQRCSPSTYPYGCNGEWAAISSASQPDTAAGALFFDFHVDGVPTQGRGYFKNIDGRIVDAFDITSTNSG